MIRITHLEEQGGSLAAEVCFNQDGYFRVVSKEIGPRPGWLVDKVYEQPKDCLTKYPVIELAVGDIEEVYIGLGGSEEETYKNMRVYKVTRTSQGLQGEFLRTETVDPDKVKLRDN